MDRAPDSDGESAVATSWRNTLAAFKREAAAAPAAAPVAVFPPEGTRFIFRPMLRVKRRKLTVYSCLPARDAAGGTLIGDAILGAYATPSRLARLDTMTLRETLTQLAAQQDVPADTLVCVPLHLNTLLGECNVDFIAMLAALPGALSRRIVYEVVDIARGRASEETGTMLARLKGLGAAVFGRINPRDPDLRVWKTAGLAAVGIDLEDETLADVDTIKAVSVFGATGRRQGVSVYARGLRTRETALAAIAIDFSYIEGPAVHDGDAACPAAAPPYDMSRLDWG